VLTPNQRITYLGTLSLAHARTRFLYSTASCFIQSGLSHAPQNVSKGIRPYALCVVSTPSPALAQTSCPGSCVAARQSTYKGKPQLCQSPGPLEGHQLVPVWCEHGSGVREEGNFNRRLLLRLGGSVRGQTCLRPLVELGEAPTYQLILK
jgi:hypothetical protein